MPIDAISNFFIFYQAVNTSCKSTSVIYSICNLRRRQQKNDSLIQKKVKATTEAIRLAIRHLRYNLKQDTGDQHQPLPEHPREKSVFQ